MIRGREAILSSYRENAEWGRRHLDAIEYESHVTPLGTSRFSVLFTDRIRVGHSRHTYRCRQVIELDPDHRIARISHREFPGQRAALNLFLKMHAIRRPRVPSRRRRIQRNSVC